MRFRNKINNDIWFFYFKYLVDCFSISNISLIKLIVRIIYSSLIVFGLAAYVNESTFATFQSFLSFNNNLQKQLPIKPAPPVTKIVSMFDLPFQHYLIDEICELKLMSFHTCKSS